MDIVSYSCFTNFLQTCTRAVVLKAVWHAVDTAVCVVQHLAKTVCNARPPTEKQP